MELVAARLLYIEAQLPEVIQSVWRRAITTLHRACFTTPFLWSAIVLEFMSETLVCLRRSFQKGNYRKYGLIKSVPPILYPMLCIPLYFIYAEESSGC